MEHTFSGRSSGRFPGIIGILRRSCFPVGKFPVKKQVPFTSFYKESPAVPGCSRRYLFYRLKFGWRMHKRMELMSNGTHSSLDGPFLGSFRKFLVNGKRPRTLVNADNRYLILAQPRDCRRKPTSLMRALHSHLRAVLRHSFLFGPRRNRVIEFACLHWFKIAIAGVNKPSDANVCRAVCHNTHLSSNFNPPPPPAPSQNLQ